MSKSISRVLVLMLVLMLTPSSLLADDFYRYVYALTPSYLVFHMNQNLDGPTVSVPEKSIIRVQDKIQSLTGFVGAQCNDQSIYIDPMPLSYFSYEGVLANDFKIACAFPNELPVPTSSPHSSDISSYNAFLSSCLKSKVLIESDICDAFVEVFDDEDDSVVTYSYIPVAGAEYNITYKDGAVLAYQCSIRQGTYANKNSAAIIKAFISTLPDGLDYSTTNSLYSYFMSELNASIDLSKYVKSHTRVQGKYEYSLTRTTYVSTTLTALPQ